MKNIFRIFKRDMITISTNWAALIMIVVLIIIPSLYSLINIKASWDPYGNTTGIKVAIINEDKGTVFKEKDINLGEDLVEKLQDNDKLGWTFVDKETGKKGLLEEKYYATIEIPDGFSEDVTTLTGKDVTKPKLIYTVNEKKNVIAPKMTDAGIKALKGQIDDNIVKTVSGAMFRICNEVGLDSEQNRPKLRKIIDEIYKLDENMPDLKNLLDDTIDGTVSASKLLQKTDEMIPVVSDTIDATGEFLDNSQNSLDKIEGSLSDISPLIKEKLVMSEDTLDASGVILGNIDENILPEVAKKSFIGISDSAESLKKIVKNAKSQLKDIKSYIDKIANIEIKLKETKDDNSEETVKNQEANNKELKYLQSAKSKLKDVSKKISDSIDKLDTIDDRLDVVIDRAGKEVEKIDSDGRLDIQAIKDTRKILEDVHALVATMVDSYDSELVPTIEEGFNSIREISDSGLILLEQGKNILPDVEKLLNNFTETSNLSNEQLVKLKDNFPDIEEKIHKLAYKLKGLDEEDKIDELLDMITNDWESQSTFMASPVEIEDNRLFPWPNYGSTATPFYTVLCLWVGGLLASALLSLEAHEFEDGLPIKAYEMYLGKLLVFLLLAIFQALVASIGALAILGSYALHPMMYIFYSIFVSVVFMTMIYTAGSILDDVGKAIIVIILVLQMAGTSGNFPIEVTPVLFQKLYPYLPFTYAINGMRQIMAGIVYPILFKDISILCIYMVASLMCGLLLKNLMSKTTTKLMNKLGESGILRH
ncbi:YhgE/Pip domain-containing protein [Clostridium uliginosum]|uniref:YhgE/Pip N-terminal domain-containing protein/YhgE/Pip C-terminal domain-containing protein n=1 Tax=Clostridium uliginosum TaxID=119641 RepID=A0A1I1RV22_9CLOT|nr:YhgE/Pip domain-containing protein [Clostridium uliginosum]SFD38095.1 YhgE/Pip N-terminal domain-containing protein/YhgE/Pip C-terminal domain-containing protein [Clostridium uliginosum]